MIFTIENVAAYLGVHPRTVSAYLWHSRPGGRYAHHPFPSPNGYAGRSPWWAAARRTEFDEWNRARPGRGRAAPKGQ